MNKSIDQSALAELRKDFRGEILLPADPAYAEGRKAFNTMIDRHPSVIARCADAGDIAKAIRFGRDAALEIAVRGGGHHVAGWSTTDGGLMIDLRRMNRVEIDPDARIARVQGGATWRDLVTACQPHGLATTGGTSPSPGVAGVTLGGGWGWLARLFGLACDNLLSVGLITADGKTVVASEDEHTELFWALHGGGGNFGVATELTLRLHSLPVATMARLVYSPDSGPEVAGRLREAVEQSSNQLCSELVYMTGPGEDIVPAHLVGTLCLQVYAFYAGTEIEAREAIEPLLKAGPVAEEIAEIPYADILNADDVPPVFRHHSASHHLATLSDGAIDSFCACAKDMVVPSGCLQALSTWGGEIARSDGDWPVAGRKAAWHVYPFGLWTDPADDERCLAWTRSLDTGMAPYAIEGSYLNVTVDEGQQRRVAGYGGEVKYRRLSQVKRQYDPDNTFHLNHNIEPA